MFFNLIVRRKKVTVQLYYWRGFYVKIEITRVNGEEKHHLRCWKFDPWGSDLMSVGLYPAVWMRCALVRSIQSMDTSRFLHWTGTRNGRFSQRRAMVYAEGCRDVEVHLSSSSSHLPKNKNKTKLKVDLLCNTNYTHILFDPLISLWSTFLKFPHNIFNHHKTYLRVPLSRLAVTPE